MEQKTIQSNSALHFGKAVFATWTAASISVIAIAAAVSSCDYQAAHSSTVTYANVQPSSYGVMTLNITSDNSGEAVINLDGFRVPVKFLFDKHPDSYGVPGSEFTAVDITNLEIGQITDANGNNYKDFTIFDDHLNINAQIAAYIEKSKLVEAI
ncbi:hypothetical protein [Acinetobacter sp. NIPH 298]|uniref:hypothetical protein n=1 Tax=Acinetobacter sp. NIPH 298 TaxID=1217692 RepID=UPI0002CF6907|nr:hypothetical protein [Acinetobacter sp. NIPH 298]ENW95749.1 hypothetical protein F903_01511 [Acinetobacter sp. NIPH 298]